MVKMGEAPVIKFLRLKPELNADIPLPRYMTSQSSGMDVCAANEEDVVIRPGEISMIPTGFAIAIAKGFEAQIRPRSGLAVKYGIGLIALGENDLRVAFSCIEKEDIQELFDTILKAATELED